MNCPGRIAKYRWILLVPTLAIPGSTNVAQEARRWIGTWSTAPQPFLPGSLENFRNQTVRLIVHTSAGGSKVRIRISNTYGDRPLEIGGARIARRTAGADIDSSSGRALTFRGRSSTTVPARSMVVSDPVELEVPALSDLAVSMFLPGTTSATTSHALALQTSYVATDTGDFTDATRFPTTTTTAQPGVKYVFMSLGINDITFPGVFTPATERVSAPDIISGYRRLIARAHARGIRVIGTTLAPFENAPSYTPEKDVLRRDVNTWIRTSGAFDAVVDFDAIVRDPGHPARLLPAFDSGDHLHVNDAGNVATANAIPLALFESR